MKKANLKNSLRKGFVSMEIILYLIVFGIVVGALYLVVYPSVKSSLDTNTYKSEYTTVLQGLNQYYSNNYQYPKANGWGWDSANTYVQADLKNKGWNYSCSGSTITLTTPALDAKSHQRLKEAYSKNASGVTDNGSKLDITLDNKPCP